MLLTEELATQFAKEYIVKLELANVLSVYLLDDAIVIQAVREKFTDNIDLKIYYKLTDTTVEKKYEQVAKSGHGRQLLKDKEFQVSYQDTMNLQNFLLKELKDQELEQYKQKCLQMRLMLENKRYEALQIALECEHQQEVERIKAMFGKQDGDQFDRGN